MDIFNIGSNYTKKELKDVFLTKIKQITKSNISDFEKKLLIEYYHHNYNLYKLSATDYIKPITNSTNSSYNFISYSKKLNPDNTYTINERKESNINGIIDKSNNSYILDAKGNKIKQLK